VTLDRVLSIGAAGPVAAAGFVLMVGGVELLLTAVRYIGAGGLGLIGGRLILPAGALALLFAASAFAGFGMALRGDRRFRLLTASSGVAVLVLVGLCDGIANGPRVGVADGRWQWRRSLALARLVAHRAVVVTASGISGERDRQRSGEDAL
jgi:hypothetical protein